MKFSRSVSSVLAVCFLVTGVSGIVLWFDVKDALTIFLHTYFALGLLLISLAHISKNFKGLQSGFRKRGSLLIVSAVSLLLIGIFSGFAPFEKLITWNAKRLAKQGSREINWGNQMVYLMTDDDTNGSISLDFLAGKHFWHPQVAIWIEDTSGNFLKTLFVTESTAKGVFYGSRTRDNFREFDEKEIGDKNDIRRVDALPYWSHKRGVKYADGFYSPPPDEPLPDAISGATPSGSFIVKTDAAQTESFKILMEVNIAFDENRYYSEYDFPDDSLYHGGTGLMGQPSLVYETIVDPDLGKKYYLMELIGRGHHSGANGKLYSDLETITTAHNIFERIVVGYHPN